MTAYTFVGPGEYIFPAFLAPPGSPPGTLHAIPGESYDFGDDTPPGPDYWWVANPPPVPPMTQPAKSTPATPQPAPATPAAPTGEGAS